jgi:hypothetical protein
MHKKKKDFQCPHFEELLEAYNLRNQRKLGRASRACSHDVTGRRTAIAALAMRIRLV